MPPADVLERFYRSVVEAGLFPREANLRYHLEALFDGVELRDRAVLDVGGGDGVHSFYAACRGAREVVCLEPEDDGSTAGAAARFRVLGEKLGLGQVSLEPVTLQAFEPGGRTFDVLLLHDSVNHLDDAACTSLLADPAARAAYRDVFSKLAALAAPGATLLVCDCARDNFFGHLGLRNPFVPTVVWSKHHAPETWAGLLREAGFEQASVRWSSPNLFGALGRALLAHRIPAYFLKSHFRMAMRRAARGPTPAA